MIDEWVKRWLTKVSNDLQVAQDLLSLPKEKRVTEAICFHSQQASEKLLKAFLAANNVDFGRTHNLEFLRDLCIKVDPDFNNLNTGKLTDYAVEVRYPEVFYTPTQEEAEESVNIAGTMCSFILTKLRVKVADLH